MEETQRDKSNALDLYSVCFARRVCVCVFGIERHGKRQDTNKKRHRGKVCEIDGLFSLLMFFNATSNNKEPINPHEDGIKSKVVQKYYPIPRTWFVFDQQALQKFCKLNQIDYLTNLKELWR